MEQQRTKEWFEKRKGRVTGSAVGAILGLNPWQSADDVLRRMVRDYHGADSEFTGNAATAHGTFHEENALFDYELENNKVIETGFHTYEGWLGASPDGLVGEDGVIEIKCPYGLRDAVEPEFKTAEEQPHYYAQMQIEMLCTGRNWCHFFQWTPKGGSYLETVERNDAWLDENLPKLRNFYDLFLTEIDNPAHLEAKEVELDSFEDGQLAERYREAKDALDKAKAELDAAKEALVKRANGNKAKCFGLSIFPVTRKGSVSYAKVVKDHCPDVDLTPYTGKPSTSWTVK